MPSERELITETYLKKVVLKETKLSPEEMPTREEIRHVLTQLGLDSHYLGEKEPRDWDGYDTNNWLSLSRKAGFGRPTQNPGDIARYRESDGVVADAIVGVATRIAGLANRDKATFPRNRVLQQILNRLSVVAEHLDFSDK